MAKQTTIRTARRVAGPSKVGKVAAKKPVTAPLRKSITPGTVLILLTGRFAGKRVVFLKQLTSGLLLVTGPFVVNGVPLRRVTASQVIATSTKVDVSAVTVPANVNDSFFAKPKSVAQKSEGEFFKSAQKKEKSVLPEAVKAAQKSVDEAILAGIKDTLVKQYLGASFQLTNGVHPHQLKF